MPDFEDLLFDVTDAIGKSFACLEIEWHRVEGLAAKTITHRPQSWFSLHRGYRQELRLRSDKAVDGIAGEPLNPFGWVTHVHKAKSGWSVRPCFASWCGRICLRTTAWAIWPSFWRFMAFPCALANTPAAPAKKDKAMLLRALASIGHNAAGIVPEGMLLEFKDAATGDPKAFELMMNWCEKNQSKVILGGT